LPDSPVGALAVSGGSPSERFSAATVQLEPCAASSESLAVGAPVMPGGWPLARILAASHAFVQNLRRGHHDIATGVPAPPTAQNGLRRAHPDNLIDGPDQSSDAAQESPNATVRFNRAITTT
jgi:hypothetical protein